MDEGVCKEAIQGRFQVRRLHHFFMNIRSMTFKDSQSVASIQVLAWQKAYKGFLPDQYLHSLDIKKKEHSWRTGLEINADVIRLVAVHNGQVLGFACGLENRQPDLFPDISHELWALYVHPDHWRKGIGAPLLQEFLKRSEGGKAAVWCLEANLAARKFYECHGGVLLHQKRETTFGGKTLEEVVYRFN